MYLDWIGTVLIALGLWKAGDKNRNAFLFSVVGELLWVVYAVSIRLWSLAAICLIFAAIAARNFWKWSR